MVQKYYLLDSWVFAEFVSSELFPITPGTEIYPVLSLGYI